MNGLTYDVRIDTALLRLNDHAMLKWNSTSKKWRTKIVIQDCRQWSCYLMVAFACKEGMEVHWAWKKILHVDVHQCKILWMVMEILQLKLLDYNTWHSACILDWTKKVPFTLYDNVGSLSAIVSIQKWGDCCVQTTPTNLSQFFISNPSRMCKLHIEINDCMHFRTIQVHCLMVKNIKRPCRNIQQGW